MMETAPRLREATLDDYPRIAALETECGLKTKKREAWEHLWTSNPAWREGRPMGWVLETPDGGIVGSVGSIPLAYEFQGRKVSAAAGRAWVSDSRYRGYALLLMERFFAQPRVDLLLNTTVNGRAAGALSVFQPDRVPAGAWDQSAFWVTNRWGFLRSYLAMKGILPAPAIGRRDIQLRASFDERFDRFWDAQKRKRSALLMGVRTREILQWHFHHALANGRAWILTVENGGALRAWSIFCRKDNPRFGLKRMRLIDFQSLEEGADLLAPMLSEALRKCREERIHMLEAIGAGKEQNRVLERLGPRRRALPWSFFYKANSRDLAQKLEDPAVWDPSGFDGDASL